MGRHSSGRSGPFVKSILGWLLPWLLIAIVVGVGSWMAFDYTNRNDATEPVAERREPEPESEAAAEPDDTPSAAESPTAEPSETDEAEGTSKADKPKKPVRLITEGVSVQVLNGTSDPAAGDAMAEKLAALGFQVVAVESTSTPYKETTVFWSFPEAKDAAKALADKLGWVADEKPGNLADTVSLHVVVGKDEL